MKAFFIVEVDTDINMDEFVPVIGEHLGHIPDRIGQHVILEAALEFLEIKKITEKIP